MPLVKSEVNVEILKNVFHRDSSTGLGADAAPSRSPTLMHSKRKLLIFTEGDADDPKNWKSSKKRFVVWILSLLSFIAVLGSSIYAPAESRMRQKYGVNDEVASTGLTMYVLGFAFGPILCPLSESHGRRLPYLIAWPLLIGSTALTAWVDNLPVILVFRFLCGTFAGAPLNNGTGFISDMYATTPRTLAKMIGIYSFTALSGPVFGSLIGFFIVAHLPHELWVLRVHMFACIVLWPLLIWLPETHGPTILLKRANKLRKQGENVVTAHELRIDSESDISQWRNYARPFTMLLIEPICIGSALWISLSYSIVYFFFECYPVVFVTQNHFEFQLGGLPFLGILGGMIICLLITDRLTQLSRHVSIPFVDPPVTGTPAHAPEAGLKVVLIACILTPASLFWFAWTSTGSVHWISPTLAGVVFGYSMLSIFYSFMAYISQLYEIYSSSAAASNTLARSIIASIFPILAHPIITNLKTTWGVSLFGFLSLGLIPIPLVYIRYGPVLREKSHFAREARRMASEMRAQQEELIENMEKKAGDDDV